ncbi:hypothetical protein GCM10010964_20330 [Caldovatus sediminis]|uniref:Uncharacterized protein n=1 Tax=Caldovatus sediminis TaxID=2041189 RepID=A0A8J3EC44_9PROT|nr:YciI family protein [Caldovatus sediminis]GGG32337.1 hypothetical protein GCM10010964_20330 [Caldovatus sediminis]
MLYAIICRDRAGAGGTRPAARPAHRDRKRRAVAARAMPGAAGAPPGSPFAVGAADEAVVARPLAASDPCAAGIRRFRLVRGDGARAG